MQGTIRLLAASFVAVGLAPAARAGTEPAATCGTYGTSVHFEATPSAAAQRALKEEKLVFVLHVSGHFEESEFT
jgi:hypothetical protein